MFIHKLIISHDRNVYNLSKYEIRVCQLCIDYHFKHKYKYVGRYRLHIKKCRG